MELKEVTLNLHWFERKLSPKIRKRPVGWYKGGEKKVRMMMRRCKTRGKSIRKHFKEDSLSRKTPGPGKEIEFFWEQLQHSAHVPGQQVLPADFTHPREVVDFLERSPEKSHNNKHLPGLLVICTGKKKKKSFNTLSTSQWRVPDNFSFPLPDPVRLNNLSNRGSIHHSHLLPVSHTA